LARLAIFASLLLLPITMHKAASAGKGVKNQHGLIQSGYLKKQAFI
jgi:hypothetical protein